MMRSIRLLLASCCVFAVSPGGVSAQAVQDTAQIATLLVSRMQLQPGERVLFVAIPGRSDALLPALRRRIAAAGATDLGVLAALGEPGASWITDFTRAGPKDRTGLATYLSTVDLAVIMPGVNAMAPVYPAMQDVLRTGKGRTIHFHWEGAYALDGSVLPVTSTRGAVYERVLLQTDYAALTAIQAEFARAARSGSVHVTTPAGTDLTFMVSDRPVTKQDGDASAARARAGRNLIDREIELPAGAIRVAPIEETVTGQVAFPPGLWSGERVEGLVMRFEQGRVTGVTAATGAAAVERELNQAGEGGRSFREFALGFNPLLAIPDTGEKWIPYYGYGAGVVRLSLGDNTELGGRVGGGYVRWNFFTDATVVVGGDTWVRAGKLIKVR
jgi:hypothetical protein